MAERSKPDRSEPSAEPATKRRRRTSPPGGTPEEGIATPETGEQAKQVAAGPSSAAGRRRRVERPVASGMAGDVTSPTSGTRSGPQGSTREADGSTRTRASRSGGDPGAAPAMPGPTGPAQTTELVGDPASRAVVVGPVATASAPPPRVDDDGPDMDPGPFPAPGGGGTGPVDPIYDVERIMRTLESRGGRSLRSPTERR